MRTRITGVCLAILAGSLLGLGEYQRGRTHGKIEASITAGSTATTDMLAAMKSAVEGVINSNRVHSAQVSPKDAAIFSNAIHTMQREGR